MGSIKFKEVYVEAAPSRNFQKYTVGGTFEIQYESDAEFDELVRKAQAKCRKLALEQIALG